MILLISALINPTGICFLLQSYWARCASEYRRRLPEFSQHQGQGVRFPPGPPDLTRVFAVGYSSSGGSLLIPGNLRCASKLRNPEPWSNLMILWHDSPMGSIFRNLKPPLLPQNTLAWKDPLWLTQ